eukprot:TRINITY_DN2885_c0_g1_i4.p1 TRINITY_DN2885_c0_g1~~TRINITY_DN2885_c0_g1_i4.p1  ORF type:complete len:660 (+),score=44.18 TRINITY_DN2885_c0_g1_i4:2710-4689(+)
MDAIISNENELTFKITGGVIDLRFFIGNESPESTIRMYHKYVGKQIIPPFWSMGFHQSKWGYSSADELSLVLDAYEFYDVPIDVIWSDTDYMYKAQTFTINAQNFPLEKLEQVVSRKRYVIILDSGIPVNEYNMAFSSGINNKLFINNTDGYFFVGSIFAGYVVYPDFLNPHTESYWIQLLENLKEYVNFSGIWLDLNEVSNFCDGWCYNHLSNQTTFDYSKDLPYQIGQQNIENLTISLNATHYGNVTEYNFHNFNSYFYCKATYYYFKKNNQFPFILTRGNIPGIQRFAHHWTGDNQSTYKFLFLAIPTIFNSNLFGISMSGSDICGFSKPSDEQLCARWIQQGAFYPFSRNHNEKDQLPQEFYRFTYSTLYAAQKSLKLRYSILKYYYTQFIISNGYGTIFRPVFFEFYNDDYLLEDYYLNSEFLIGDSLLIAPVVLRNKSYRIVYFPINSTWYDYIKGYTMYGGKHYNVTNYWNATPPIYLRGGKLILSQDTSQVLDTRDLDNIFNIKAAFSNDSIIRMHSREKEQQQGDNEEEEDYYYHAQGYLVAIDLQRKDEYDLFEDLLICQEQMCLYNISLYQKVNFPYNLYLDVRYMGKTIQPIEIIISGIFVYGISEEKIVEIKIENQLFVETTTIQSFQIKIVNDNYDNFVDILNLN